MLIAAKARLFKKRTDIPTLRVTSNLISMLFIRGFERTQYIYNAMASRGYKGNLEILDEFKFCVKDFLKAFLITIIAIVFSLARFIS